MEPVLSPEEMRRADERTIAGGTSSFELMDRAAYACAIVTARALPARYGRRVAVVAGPGNNGGDGVAAAYHLARLGVRVRLFLTGEPRGASAAHLERLRATGPRGYVRAEAWNAASFDDAAVESDRIVDAVFGTGFSGAARGPGAEAIGRILACGRPVVAVDIPSGVPGETGAPEGPFVRASVTVAIQALKTGHVVMPGAEACGRVVVAPIGIETGPASAFVPSAEDVRRALPARDARGSKYDSGVVAVLAGSAGMSGAAILTARGALGTGAGLVYMGVSPAVLPAVEAAVVEAVKVGLPDRDGGLDASSLDGFQRQLGRADAVAVGPGLGTGDGARSLVRRILEAPVPVVVDADGLSALATVLRDEPGVLRARSAATVLTPHAGELERLIGREPGADSVGEARAAADRLGAVVHFKGMRAVTASPSGEVWIDPAGTPALSSGGTGDVLTGVVATLLARGAAPETATWAAAWLHGLAGRLAGERAAGTPAASGVAACLPGAIARVLASRPRRTGSLRTVVEAVGA